MRFLISLFFLLILCTSVYAQKEKEKEYEDVLYLKGESIFRGKLLEYDPEGQVVFETYQGIVLRLDASQVEKIHQELLSAPGVGRRDLKDHRFKESVLYQHLSGGFSAGYDAGASLNYVIGHRFSRMLSLGLGTGIHNFELGYGRQIIPVFAEYRAYLSGKNISPMLAMKAGYGFALKNENAGITDASGGFLLSPEVGYRFGGHSAHFTLSAALHFQWAEFSERWGNWENTENMRYQRLEIRAGLLF